MCSFDFRKQGWGQWEKELWCHWDLETYSLLFCFRSWSTSNNSIPWVSHLPLLCIQLYKWQLWPVQFANYIHRSFLLCAWYDFCFIYDIMFLASSRIFWFGDLNYRINIVDAEVRKLVAVKKWDKLLFKDQVYRIHWYKLTLFTWHF